ncbi:MAG: hypothetical protein ACI9TV_000569 [Sulfurimonas sp.]|jgi:hypothetical protein|uniref:hypothetical protein n=1 Tax=Sulfurimonas sp. TaxID=2022749 RepID=UPI0039E4FD20
MSSKLMVPVVALSIMLLMGIYFLVNPSYEKSIKAKYYFETGKYKEALVLSREAFSEDQYNRMAATVMAQSITSLKYVKYINMGKSYITQIDKIAQHKYISDADKAKIRIICEIMIASYIKLAPSVITDDKLVEDSAYYYQKFEKLLEKVIK